MKFFPWFRKKTPKINFEEEKLVLCYLELITDYKEWIEGNIIHWKALHEKIPKIRILVKEKAAFWDRYYEPEELLKDAYHRKCYYDCISKVEGVGDFLVTPLHKGLPIQYLPRISLTEEESMTKEITLERIKELEDLLNSK